MFYVRVFYKKCPTCKQTWSAQLSQADVIRIGKEAFVCKCGTAWPTGRVEWAHLTPRMRRSYFLSTAEIGVLILCPFMGGLFTFFIAQDKWMGLLWGILDGLVVAAVFVAFMWALKFTIVKFSLRRCPLDLLSTPFGSGFFDLIRDPVSTIASAGDSVSDQAGLIAQFHSIRPISWIFAGLAVAGLALMEYTEYAWLILMSFLALFVLSLRKLRPSATGHKP
jgi:hypothetical protein